jgi:uncharacterized membrane protein
LKKFSLYLMAFFYLAAGINHFVNRAAYLSIVPSFLPHPLEIVYISGFCEAVFGILLIPVYTRRAAAWAIILLLVAVFPANIKMMLDSWNAGSLQHWATLFRLPVQLLLAVWAYLFTKPPSPR